MMSCASLRKGGFPLVNYKVGWTKTNDRMFQYWIINASKYFVIYDALVNLTWLFSQIGVFR
jgi:hypothetical protein